MAETSIRRKRVVIFFLVAALIGGVLKLLGEPRSWMSELGSILVAVWIIPASMFVFWFAKSRARLVPMPLKFAPGTRFVPTLTAEVTLTAADRAPGQGECKCIFVVGTQGFTARFILPEGVLLEPRVPRQVDVQFLRPEVAAPYFPAGGEFSLLEGSKIVGSGRVIAALDAAAG
jgi:hypothetical protein